MTKKVRINKAIFGKKVFNVEYSKFYEHFCKARKKINIEYFRAHDLRACFCTNALLSGVTIPEVAALSGHKDWKMLKRYTRIKTEDLQDKVNNIVCISKKQRNSNKRRKNNYI